MWPTLQGPSAAEYGNVRSVVRSAAEYGKVRQQEIKLKYTHHSEALRVEWGWRTSGNTQPDNQPLRCQTYHNANHAAAKPTTAHTQRAPE